jgi:hypothetical protein
MRTKTPRVFALITAGTLCIMLVSGFAIVYAANPPPSGNVVPNFSALKVAGDTTVGGVCTVKDLTVTGDASADMLSTGKISLAPLNGSASPGILSGSISQGIEVRAPLSIKEAVGIAKSFSVTGSTTLNSTLNLKDSMQNPGTNNGGAVKISDPEGLNVTGDINVQGKIKNGTASDANRLVIDDFLDVLKSVFMEGFLTIKDGSITFTNAINSDTTVYDDDEIKNGTTSFAITADSQAHNIYSIGSNSLKEGLISLYTQGLTITNPADPANIDNNVTIDNANVNINGNRTLDISNGTIESKNIKVDNLYTSATALTSYIRTKEYSETTPDIDPGDSIEADVACGSADYIPIFCGANGNANDYSISITKLRIKDNYCAVKVVNKHTAAQSITFRTVCLHK